MTEYFKPISYNLWENNREEFSAELGKSFRETGFAIITDHPIPESVIARNLTATKAFFALSEPQKLKYDAKPNGGQRGYTAFGTESAKGVTTSDLKEFWHTGRRLPADSPYLKSMLPTPEVTEITDFNDATYELYEALDEMGRVLLRGVARHLGLDENWFESRVNFGNSILRLLHYPPQMEPPPKVSVRASAHEDINVITLLLGAEEAGLQARHRSGKWLDINPEPGALVVNCGDMLQRLTGGILPSTTHRVLNPSPERSKFSRYSTPFFLHFNQDVLIEALPGCLAEGGQAEPAITAQDYLMERLREIGLVKT